MLLRLKCSFFFRLVQIGGGGKKKYCENRQSCFWFRWLSKSKARLSNLTVFFSWKLIFINFQCRIGIMTALVIKVEVDQVEVCWSYARNYVKWRRRRKRKTVSPKCVSPCRQSLTCWRWPWWGWAATLLTWGFVSLTPARGTDTEWCCRSLL